MEYPSSPVLAPIVADDLWDVGGFLHDRVNSRVSTPEWSSAIVPTWAVDSPNHGYLLRREGRIVGVQLAIYSRREIGGIGEDFCNLGVHHVEEPFVRHGERLVRALLDQPGYTFTDLSGSTSMLELEEALGFVRMEDHELLVPNLPLSRPRGTRIISDPEAIGDLLVGADRRIFYDHLRSSAAIHLVLVRGDERCYVMLRRDRRSHHPAYAKVIHVSDAEVLRRRLPDLGRHLLLHHATPFTLVDLRMIGSRPPLATHLRSPRPKLYLSTHVPAESIDDLYSEVALVAW